VIQVWGKEGYQRERGLAGEKDIIGTDQWDLVGIIWNVLQNPKEIQVKLSGRGEAERERPCKQKVTALESRA